MKSFRNYLAQSVLPFVGGVALGGCVFQATYDTRSREAYDSGFQDAKPSVAYSFKLKLDDRWQGIIFVGNKRGGGDALVENLQSGRYELLRDVEENQREKIETKIAELTARIEELNAGREAQDKPLEER